MQECNAKIRQAAKKAGIPLWKVADQYGINDGNFSRLLRHELPPDQQKRILHIIDDLKEG